MFLVLVAINQYWLIDPLTFSPIRVMWRTAQERCRDDSLDSWRWHESRFSAAGFFTSFIQTARVVQCGTIIYTILTVLAFFLTQPISTLPLPHLTVTVYSYLLWSFLTQTLTFIIATIVYTIGASASIAQQDEWWVTNIAEYVQSIKQAISAILATWHESQILPLQQHQLNLVTRLDQYQQRWLSSLPPTLATPNQLPRISIDFSHTS